MPACVEDVERYSLQEDNYLFVLNCPPGYDCGQIGTIFMTCCDGTELLVQLSETLLAVERQKIIQAMMEECARRMAFCSPYNPDPPNGPGTPSDPNDPTNPNVAFVMSYNAPQSATIQCPGGGSFTYTVPAGKFIASTQAQADTRARQYALQYAQQHAMCLTNLSGSTCEGSAVNAKLFVYGPALGNAHCWSVVSGTLPDGLVLETGWLPGTQTQLTGTATTAGSFTFTVRATGNDNLYVDRTFTVCVIALDPASLSDATIGQPYSETLIATGCAAPPLSWQIVSGTLPDGVFLNEETGEISGTPTETGDFPFTIRLQTEAT
jgi:hypothetical protein